MEVFNVKKEEHVFPVLSKMDVIIIEIVIVVVKIYDLDMRIVDVYKISEVNNILLVKLQVVGILIIDLLIDLNFLIIKIKEVFIVIPIYLVKLIEKANIRMDDLSNLVVFIKDLFMVVLQAVNFIKDIKILDEKINSSMVVVKEDMIRIMKVVNVIVVFMDII